MIKQYKYIIRIKASNGNAHSIPPVRKYSIPPVQKFTLPVHPLSVLSDAYGAYLRLLHFFAPLLVLSCCFWVLIGAKKGILRFYTPLFHSQWGKFYHFPFLTPNFC